MGRKKEAHERKRERKRSFNMKERWTCAKNRRGEGVRAS